jgi:glycosyltransferase
MPPHPALFLRRDVYDRVALEDGVYFDPAFRCAGDYDFMLRALPQLNSSPVYLPGVLVRMRTGGVSNRSLGHIVRKSCEDWRVIRRNRMGGLHTLIGKNVRKAGQLYAPS